MESHYSRIYTGSMIIVQLLTSRLEEVGIKPVIKEQNESGLDPKIYGGHLLQEMYVHEDELEKAKEIMGENKFKQEFETTFISAGEPQPIYLGRFVSHQSNHLIEVKE